MTRNIPRAPVVAGRTVAGIPRRFYFLGRGACLTAIFTFQALLALLLPFFLQPAPATNPELALQVGHSGPVESIAFSPDGSTMATGCGIEGSGTVKLWDVHTEEIKKTIRRVSGVYSVAYSPDGRTLASGCADKTVKLWDVRTGDLKKTLRGHASVVTSVAFSPDGRTLASGSVDHSVKLWDVRSGVLKKTLKGQADDWMKSVAYSPDSLTLASSGGKPLKLWNARTGELEKSLYGHTQQVLSVAYSPDGKTLASGGLDDTVRLWDAITGELEHTHEAEGWVDSLAFSPDGNLLASGSVDHSGAGTVALWDARTGDLQKTLKGHTRAVSSIAFSPDGDTLASGSWTNNGSGTVTLWNARTWEIKKNLQGHGAWVGSVAFSPDGNTLSSRISDRTVTVWDSHTGEAKKAIQTFGAAISVAFSPDGRIVAAGGGRDRSGTVTLLDARTGEYKTTLVGHARPVISVAFSPDGNTLASGSYDNTVKLWDAHTGELKQTLQGFGAAPKKIAPGVFDASPGDELLQGFGVAPEKTVHRHNFLVRSVAFSPDGNTLAVASEDTLSPDLNIQFPEGGMKLPDVTGVVTLWNFRTGELKKTLECDKEYMNAMAFSPDGKTLASGSADFSDVGTVVLWDARTGEVKRAIRRVSAVHTLAFSPDGSTLAGGSLDETVKLWDARTGEIKKTLEGHGALVNSLAFSPDGKTLASGGNDGTVKLWDPVRGGPVATLVPFSAPESKSSCSWMAFTPHGYYSGSPGAAQSIRWLVDNDLYPVSSFRSVYYRPDVVAKTLEWHDDTRALEKVDEEAGRRTQVVSVEKMRPPIVRILSPDDGAGAATDILTLRYSLRTPSGQPVTSIKVLVDGVPMAQDRDLQKIGTAGTQREISIPVPPRDCLVSVIAGNRFCSSEPDSIHVHWTGTNPGEDVLKPKLYLLAVGISQYSHPDWALQFPTKDATDFVAAMKEQKGKLYSDVVVRLLTDGDATRENILDGLAWILKQTTPHDMAAVFLAGQGVNAKGGSSYFAPVNFNPDQVKNAGLAFSDIKRGAEALAGRVLFFVDCGHPGNGMGSERARALDLTSVIDDLSSPEIGATVFAASTRLEQGASEQADWGNDAFTKALLEGLSGKADSQHKGTITANMLGLFISYRVKKLTDSREIPTMTMPTTVPDFPVAMVK